MANAVSPTSGTMAALARCRRRLRRAAGCSATGTARTPPSSWRPPRPTSAPPCSRCGWHPTSSGPTARTRPARGGQRAARRRARHRGRRPARAASAPPRCTPSRRRGPPVRLRPDHGRGDPALPQPLQRPRGRRRRVWRCSLTVVAPWGLGYALAALITAGRHPPHDAQRWICTCFLVAGVVQGLLVVTVTVPLMLVAAFVLGVAGPERQDLRRRDHPGDRRRRLPRPRLLVLRRRVQRGVRGRGRHRGGGAATRRVLPGRSSRSPPWSTPARPRPTCAPRGGRGASCDRPTRQRLSRPLSHLVTRGGRHAVHWVVRVTTSVRWFA